SRLASYGQLDRRESEADAVASFDLGLQGERRAPGAREALGELLRGRRGERRPQRPADELAARPAEQPLGGRVAPADEGAVVRQQDRVAERRERACEAVVVLGAGPASQRGACSLSTGRAG